MLTRWLIMLFLLFWALPLAAHGSVFLYDEDTLKSWKNRYQENAQWNFDNAILKKLAPKEQLELRGVRLEFPLAEENPLEFYSIPVKRTIYLPVQSIKFLDDLCIANAWLLRNNFSVESIYYYIGIRSYRRPESFPGGRYPRPLVALQIPDNALKDPWVDDVSQKLLKSALVFIMGHELGHLYYHHAPDSPDPQKQEREADTFALEVFRRLGTVPAGMSIYFTVATYLTKHPGDFSNDAQWQAFIRRQSHPFTPARLHSVAAGLRQRPEDFAKSEPRFEQAVRAVAAIANDIDGIARIQEDADFSRAFAHACNKLDLQILLKPRRPGEPLMPSSSQK